MLKKWQRPLTLLKPDAERYVDIIDQGQTQAVTVTDPPDPSTSLFALCAATAVELLQLLILTPHLCSHMPTAPESHISTSVSKVTFWTFASYCQFHHVC